MSSRHQSPLQTKGFTIVELIIVVVVIAILATLTIIAFNGIRQQASGSAVKAELNQAAKQLEIEKVSNGQYPATVAGITKGGSFNYQYSYMSGTNSFCLTVANSSSEYHITNTNSSPQDGVCSGHTSLLDVPEVVLPEIATGMYHSCSLDAARVMHCWGQGIYGQLGNGTGTNSLIPIAVNISGALSGKTITKISAGASHTCAVADGAAYCWGRNSWGQLGTGTSDVVVPTPVLTSGVLSGKTVTDISAGNSHTCVIADGAAYCWGYNAYGGLGNSTNSNSSSPVAVTSSGVLSGKTITAIDAGGFSTCAIADGAAYCWGYNNEGGLGDSTNTNNNTPVAVTASGVLSGKTITEISTGDYHACAVADGAAYCWGNDTDGQVGNNSTTNVNAPVAVNVAGVLGGKTVTKLAAGAAHTCAIANSAAYCWGNDASSSLGNGSGTGSTLVPGAVDTSGVLGGKSLTTISSTSTHACVFADGHPYCWGYNQHGALGNNTTSSSVIPVQVLNL